VARPASDISLRIVHAARERFLVQGVDGASLRQIAKDAGTSIGMVYYYFKTKDELFLAVVEEVYAVLLADLTEALGEDVPPEARLARLYQRFARMDDTEFKVLRLFMREALVSSARFRSLAARFQTGHLPLIARTLAQGMEGGAFRGDVHPLALAAATAALAIMPQIAHRLLTSSQLPIGAALPSTQEAAGALVELLMHGIGASAPRK
jgi:AcrR family transcriptional regulator